MPSVNDILDFRIDIHPEFQGWILLFATITAIFLFCLPCYCAGLAFASARRFAAWLSQRLPAFYFCMSIFNCVFLMLIVQWLPDWDLVRYLKVLVDTIGGTLKHLLECASSIAVIAAFCIAVAFKDRIAQLFGFDHKTLFRCKVRDCLTCWGPTRFQPIQLAIWKVEDLASADLFTANNVFVEFFMGYNEPMKTRVQNNAGSGCIIKENIHLNFDQDDEEETLFIFVRNQKVMGTSELARAEIPTERLRKMLRSSDAAAMYPTVWADANFGEPISLIPRGKIWIRAQRIHEADEDTATC